MEIFSTFLTEYFHYFKIDNNYLSRSIVSFPQSYPYMDSIVSCSYMYPYSLLECEEPLPFYSQ
jgi:hypothetical protein